MLGPADGGDTFGKLIGLANSTDSERANFTYGAFLLIILSFASSAMHQPAFDRHEGGLQTRNSVFKTRNSALK